MSDADRCVSLFLSRPADAADAVDRRIREDAAERLEPEQVVFLAMLLGLLRSVAGGLPHDEQGRP